MDINYIIFKSLQDYDSTFELMNHLHKNAKLEPKEKTNSAERDLWTFYDMNTGEVILKTEVEILGIYHNKFKIWCWAWSIPVLSTLDTFLSKEMLLYALKIGPEFAYLKSILTTSRGSIDDPTQVDIHVALASYILKQPYIYEYKQKVEDYVVTRYYILLNIEGLNKILKKIKKTGKSDSLAKVDELVKIDIDKLNE